jgi:uncharacterized protein (DUF983 family)
MDKGLIWTGISRGFVRKCPNCDKGKLFRGYLKVDPHCGVCGHDNGQYPADDAPPYFTILIVGHLVIAPLLFFPFIWTWNPFVVAGMVLPPLGLLTVGLLPLVKGATVGLHWALDLSHQAVDEANRQTIVEPEGEAS